MQIDQQTQEILAQSTINGPNLTLPQGQLDRKVYEKVNKILEALGGKWNKKAKAHVFESDASSIISSALSGGTVVDKKAEFQFFETPIETARYLVELAEIEDWHEVLEPSAGRGRIVRALLEIDKEPFVCELEKSNAKYLEDSFDVELLTFDFLELEGKLFDRIIANPPFSKDQDILHVTHMFELLRPGGRLVSIMSPGWTFKSTKKIQAFKKLIDSCPHTWEILPEGTFKESGTMVKTGILVLDKLT